MQFEVKHFKSFEVCWTAV